MCFILSSFFFLHNNNAKLANSMLAQNQKLRTEVDKRGRLIYKLVSKLYESKIQYNNVPTPQYHYSIALSM